jgi:hypothetical protein
VAAAPESDLDKLERMSQTFERILSVIEARKPVVAEREAARL